jgi:hypothetical protein
MPVHYRYDDAARRLLTRCEGEVTIVEVIAHFRELTGVARFHPGSDVVIDLMFQSNLPPLELIDSAATVLEDVVELIPFGRCAIVAPNDLANEIGRRFQAVAWPIFSGMRLFPNAADAHAWLDAD